MRRAGARDRGVAVGREERAWNFGLGLKLRQMMSMFTIPYGGPELMVAGLMDDG